MQVHVLTNMSDPQPDGDCSRAADAVIRRLFGAIASFCLPYNEEYRLSEGGEILYLSFERIDVQKSILNKHSSNFYRLR